MMKLTIGLDLGDRYSQLCAVDGDGVVVAEERVATARTALAARLAGVAPCRVVVEAGTHAGWVSRALEAAGHEVLVANSRKLRWLYGNEHKTDRVDATYLARVGRWDPTLLAPVRVRRAEADGALRLVRARASLVRARTRLVNHVRGAVKSVGARLPACDATSLARRVTAQVPVELAGALPPVLAQIAALTATIARYDRTIEAVATTQYPVTARLRQVTGVGALTALEVSIGFDRIEDAESALPHDVFVRSPLPWDAAFLAGKCFQSYRRRGGRSARPCRTSTSARMRQSRGWRS